jgi:DNA-binding CsgD family transcriptional regulator
MKQVARELGITARTVAFHKYRAMEMNGLRNNADLMEFAVRNGILAPWSQPRS